MTLTQYQIRSDCWVDSSEPPGVRCWDFELLTENYRLYFNGDILRSGVVVSEYSEYGVVRGFSVAYTWYREYEHLMKEVTDAILKSELDRQVPWSRHLKNGPCKNQSLTKYLATSTDLYDFVYKIEQLVEKEIQHLYS